MEWGAHLQMVGLLPWSKEEMMATRKGGVGVCASCEKREVFGFWVPFVDRFQIEVGL